MGDDSEREASPASEALTEFVRALVKAWAEELERIRPALDALARFMSDPEVRAVLERAKTEPRPQPCHCLCGYSHPADKGVCDMEGVTTRRYVTEAMGTADVLLCAPCAVAQGLAELSR